jgi:hypothetical protein
MRFSDWRGDSRPGRLLAHRCRACLVPGVQLAVNRDEGEEPRYGQLLALYELRRGMECVASARRARGWPVAMTDVRQLVRDLTELIEALDRRVSACSSGCSFVRASDERRKAERDAGVPPPLRNATKRPFRS